MSKSTFKRSLMATTMIAGFAVATPAFAQTPPQPPAPVTPTDTQGNTPPAAPNSSALPAGPQTNVSAGPAQPTASQEIVITGTLIRNPNLISSAPVAVVGHDEIQLRQANTAEEILRTIPGTSAAVGSQVNNGTTGAGYVNLRSLGSNRNIILLDGVRIVPFDQLGRVDLNTIPLALIDRVDVLTGGASSTYGADAVAGVINFITRSDFSGMELQVSDQVTQRGDGMYKRGDLTIGSNFDDNRGNAVISLGYQESEAVFQGHDRPWSDLALDSNSPGTLGVAGSSVTTPTAIDTGNPSVGRLQVNPTGTTLGAFYQPFNFNPYNVFQTPFQRYNMFSAAHYDITDHLTVYARGMFNQTQVNQIVAPSGDFGTVAPIPLSNPFMTDAQSLTLCQAVLPGTTAAQCAAYRAATNPSDPNFKTVTVGFRRRTPEVGPRIREFDTRMWDFRAGVRGDITDKIGFDVFVTRGMSNNVQNIQNFTQTSRINQALMATNTTTCLDPSNNCVPLNFFGPSGSITPAMADFIRARSTITTDTKLSQGRATINGDLPIQLWAKNPVSFAVGGEYRKYGSDETPDSLAGSGDLGGFGSGPPPVVGGLDVYEGFAEVIAPIVSDTPFFNELQVEAGIRRSHYHVFAPSNPKFDTTTWKIAATWAPTSDIKFRGGYNRAVRAPSISELFAPQSTTLTNLSVDPCAGAAPLTNANLAAVCVAQGAKPGQLGSILNPNGGQANTTILGSLTLKPETASTWTVGAVVRPRFLRNFSATIDYYNIKVAHAITLPTSDDDLAACFGNLTASSATNPACTNIRRNTFTGALDGDPAQVPGLFGQLTNNGRLSTDGIDFSFNYRQDIGEIMMTRAKLAFALGGNWTHSQKFQASPIGLNRECAGFYSQNCGYPSGNGVNVSGGNGGGGLLPKFTFTERSTLSLGKLDLSLLWRHISPMRYEPGLPPLFSGTVTSGPSSSIFINDPGNLNGKTVNFNKIPAFNYFDFATRFNVNEHLDVTFTVMNLLDKKPPIVGNTAGTTSQNSGDTFPATYDPLGRRFAAGATIKF